MRTVRASEIGTYIYCQHAWFYQKRGEVSANQMELAGGRDLHERHGQAVLAIGCVRTLAFALLLLALALLAVYLTQQIL